MQCQPAQADPSWWTSPNAVIDVEAETNDFAAVNMGQLKWIATNAATHISTNLPGGVGTTLQGLLDDWLDDGTNYVAVNVGQLKHLGSNFYERLIAVGYTNAYPWVDDTNESDYAVANVGQVKHVFGFDLRADMDADSLPDWWETHHFGSTNASATDDDDGDGYLNIYEYVHGGDPTNSASWPAATHYVSLAGSHTPPFDSWAKAATNIQLALDAATNDFEVVLVSDGVYAGAGNYNLRFPTNPIVLSSTGGMANCVIDCEARGRGIIIDRGQGLYSSVANLTILQGWSESEGGGIFCSNSAFSVLNCNIVSNWTGQGGGGIGLYRTPDFIARNCIIQENVGTEGGGGVEFWDAIGSLQNCVLARNMGADGGGIKGRVDGGAGSTGYVQNCTLVNNYCEPLLQGGAVSTLIVHGAGLPYFSISNSILWSDAETEIAISGGSCEAIHCNIRNWSGGGEGNISQDPLLEAGTWRLMASSPCIDAGASNSLETDREGEFRWDNTNVSNVASVWDIGADEYVDRDYDGWVDARETELGSDPSDSSSFPVNVSGLVSDAFTSTGLLCVIAATNATDWSSPFRTSQTNNGTYLVVNVPAGTNYWLRAFRDLNGNGWFDGCAEYGGEYASNPVVLVGDLSGANIAFFEPEDDGDFVPAADELNSFGTDPCAADTDGDGFDDYWELRYGTDPLTADAALADEDADGLDTSEEYQWWSNPLHGDTDGDGMPDAWELSHLFNPTSGVDRTLVSWWRMDESSGSVLRDDNRLSANDGSLVGDAELVLAGQVRNALQLTGGSGHARIAESSSLTSTNGCTVALWVNPFGFESSNALVHLISKGMASGELEYDVAYLAASNRLCFRHRNTSNESADVGATISLQTNAWTHVAVTVSGSNVVFYTNGLAVGPPQDLAFDRHAGGDVHIGWSPVTNESILALNGLLDEIRFYSVPLAPARVDDLLEGVRDADGDGISNRDEHRYGLNPRLSDMNLDSDGDGATNWQEIAWGTGILNPDSDGDGTPDGADSLPLVANHGNGDPNRPDVTIGSPAEGERVP